MTLHDHGKKIAGLERQLKDAEDRERDNRAMIGWNVHPVAAGVAQPNHEQQAEAAEQEAAQLRRQIGQARRDEVAEFNRQQTERQQQQSRKRHWWER
jgi:hypothetical protein